MENEYNCAKEKMMKHVFDLWIDSDNKHNKKYYIHSDDEISSDDESNFGSNNSDIDDSDSSDDYDYDYDGYYSEDESDNSSSQHSKYNNKKHRKSKKNRKDRKDRKNRKEFRQQRKKENEKDYKEIRATRKDYLNIMQDISQTCFDISLSQDIQEIDRFERECDKFFVSIEKKDVQFKSKLSKMDDKIANRRKSRDIEKIYDKIDDLNSEIRKLDQDCDYLCQEIAECLVEPSIHTKLGKKRGWTDSQICKFYDYSIRNESQALSRYSKKQDAFSRQTYRYMIENFQSKIEKAPRKWSNINELEHLDK